MGSTGAFISHIHPYFTVPARKAMFQTVIKGGNVHTHKRNSSSQLPRSRPQYQSQF